MTDDKGIFIRNIYYMLTYAFQELKSNNNFESIAKEDFEQVHDLLAEILYKGVSIQLKQGLYREYINRQESLPLLRGRLDMHTTIRNRIGRKNELGCEYDTLSVNNIFNRILKSTLLLLVRHTSVQTKRKSQLRTLLPFFADIEEIELSHIRWESLCFRRNNRTYRLLMNICYFVVDTLLLTTETGKFQVKTFTDEHMCRLYERFVLEYYRTHHKQLRANADKIEWNIYNKESRVIEFLPTMRTDITLHHNDKILIIDTKYYGRTMQQRYDKRTVHSSNMYQIFAYVKNLDTENTGRVSGLLLYAKTNEEVTPDFDEIIGKNRFLVKTLDLNVPFPSIAARLDRIVEEVFS